MSLRHFHLGRQAQTVAAFCAMVCLFASAAHAQPSWFNAYLLFHQDQGNDDAETGDEHAVSTGSESTESALPEWIAAGSFKDSDGTTYHVVKTNFQFTEKDADEALKQEVVKKISEVFDEQIKPGAGVIIDYDFPRVRDQMGPTHMVAEQSTEAVLDVAGDDYPKTYTKYAQLHIDEEFVSEARKIWHQKVVQSRVQQTTVIGFAILGILGVVFGFLHFNRVTRGLHTGRLQLIGLASILILVAIAVAVGESFEWF